MKKNVCFKIPSLLLCSALLSAGAFAASQTLYYTYDELGRVTYVEDSVNGDHDYDYDNAGNRTVMAVGVSSDSEVEGADPQALTAPKNLDLNGPLSPFGGGYNFSWASVENATHYQVRLSDGTQFTTTNTFGSSAGPAASWVAAVNSSGMGPKGFF